MTEAFLQYVWLHQLLDDDLSTTEGLPVQVLSAGALNTDAGPDFFNARVKIGGVMWVGNVEAHVKASEWRQHGHQNDAAYNNVVLHVVYDGDESAYTAEGRALPTVKLKDYIHQSLWANYEALVNPPEPIRVPCIDTLVSLPQFQISSFLERLTAERIERKTADVMRLLDEAHGGWEQCCYWLVAHYMGGKANAFPFELLAKATDMRLLARWKDNPQRVEALLMGQAGLLEGYFDDDYPRQLQADYQALRSGSRLTPISGHLWKFFRLRPSSFPTLRISQFAQLVSRSSGLFAHLLDIADAERLIAAFDVQASPYWQTHYQFDKPSPRRLKAMGKALSLNIIINAWVPLLFAYGAAHSDNEYKDRALDILHQLPPEDNKIVRMWGQLGIEAADAAATQALLQLYGVYCSAHQCLQCHFGYKVLKNSAQ